MIEWNNEDYIIGIKSVDDQHKTLICLINALEKKKWTNDKAYMKKVINTLIEYTKLHFSDEEKIMKKMDYPKLDIHIIQHKDFVDRIIRYSNDFDSKSEYDANLLPELLSFLTEWLLNHISNQDKDYYKWLVT